MAEGASKQGWLLKWTNYMKGFCERWFVLERGVLSYYRTKEEMQHTCRGTLVLKDARIDTETGNNFIVYTGAKRAGQYFELRAHSERERQEWITALELAKQSVGVSRSNTATSRHRPQPAQSSTVESQPALPPIRGESESEGEEEEDETVLPPDTTLPGLLRIKMASVQRLHDTLVTALDVFSDRLLTPPLDALSGDLQQDLATIKINVSGLLAECADLMEETRRQCGLMSRAITRKNQQSTQLQDTLKSLAVEHERLERTATRAQQKGALLSAEELAASDDEQDEFFDLDETPTTTHPAPAAAAAATTSGDGVAVAEREGSVSLPVVHTHAAHPTRAVSDSTIAPPADHSSAAGPLVPVAAQGKFVRRTRVPVRPNVKLSLWSVMKNSIGKDLSKIPMPVHFNEPLSFTQRLTEDLEYSALLDRAAKSSNAYERLALVAAFTVSSFACISLRVGKPFNPLLAETFEADRRDDYGWRSICEQVSHHPPIAALHSEGRGWVFWQEFSMDSKFRGKYLEVIPTGISHVILTATNDHYTWTKVPTSIHNIIVGKLWCDNHGTMNVTNHTTGDVCTLTYTPYSYFTSGSARKVTGVLRDRGTMVRGNMEGTWDSSLYFTSVARPDDRVLLWQREEPLPDCEAMYGFTRLAMTLNEMAPVDKGCAPTDSRFRQDKNVMESGDFDTANMLKEKLEEAQRARRKAMEKEGKHWEPIWFKHVPDPVNPDRRVFQYKGGYWEAKAEGNWSKFNLPPLYTV